MQPLSVEMQPLSVGHPGVSRTSLSVRLGSLSGKEEEPKEQVGSQYRCGRVGRGIQPQASPQSHPQLPSYTLTHKQYQQQHPKYPFFAFPTQA